MVKFWGSRFESSTDSLADQFSFSIAYDYRLAKYDCLVGIAHAGMLGSQKIIPAGDARKIVRGLKKIITMIDQGEYVFDPGQEDIHSDIQTQLKNMIGPAADRLHTARSRNDLIATDMKLYASVELLEMIGLITSLQTSLVNCADQHQDVMIPAYTHLQGAQVVLLAHHFLAYVEMLDRDKWRMFHCLERMDELPLGSCALSGTTLPIDRQSVAMEIGFSDVMSNSIDAVSDRDFVLEVLSILAMVGVHFSRIAEDLVLWSTAEFNFVDIDWSLCTGSSIMPHKKNPDICELIRGETAALISNLNQGLVLMKGLPLTYNRDMQLDKPPLFASVEKSKMMTMLLAKLFDSLKIKKDILAARVLDESFFTVDLMEYLIRKGVRYREAHDTVGRMVKECLDKGQKISDMPPSAWKAYHVKFDSDAKKILDPRVSVKMKQSTGSTNPRMVQKQIEEWKKILHSS
jgi:argininosuccinate lyase